MLKNRKFPPLLIFRMSNDRCILIQVKSQVHQLISHEPWSILQDGTFDSHRIENSTLMDMQQEAWGYLEGYLPAGSEAGLHGGL